MPDDKKHIHKSNKSSPKSFGKSALLPPRGEYNLKKLQQQHAPVKPLKLITMHGGLRVVVLSFKFHQNPLSGFRDVRRRNSHNPITLANGQSVISTMHVISITVAANIM